MLAELHARDLGVIADLTLGLEPGLTALTGETGAGKTLVVEAIELLVGERADPVLVRPGADEARVEGRFFLEDGTERVVARVVPRIGRSRAYLDGRLASAAELAALGRGLIDLHGQHAHQSLLSPRVQREALDRFGDVDLGPLQAATARLAAVEMALAALGGDERARAREADLLRYQIGEIEAARVEGPDEEERLEAEEDVLADAAAHREAGAAAYAALAGDDGAADWLGRAVAACGGRRPFAELESRLRALTAEVDDAAADVRHTVDSIVVDPERLEALRARRRMLADLRRKYGERLSDVLDFESQTRARLAELEQHGERARALEQERAEVGREVARAAAAVAAARRRAAPRLAGAIGRRLQELAMPGARFEVGVDGPDPADDVTFLLGANRGEAVLPLAKVASGGELARAMLAVRLVLGEAGRRRGERAGSGDGGRAGSGDGGRAGAEGDVSGVGARTGRPGDNGAAGRGGGRRADDGPAAERAGGPGTLVFDEVDAGIGGQAALAVGAALAALAADRQVLVVTHLPQVAAYADHQVAVVKTERDGRTVAEAVSVAGEERVVELSRMLSGQPASATARDHAEELLATASRHKAGGG
jgi:DNA repair protein RecN (Recombination protein N)